MKDFNIDPKAAAKELTEDMSLKEIEDTYKGLQKLVDNMQTEYRERRDVEHRNENILLEQRIRDSNLIPLYKAQKTESIILIMPLLTEIRMSFGSSYVDKVAEHSIWNVGPKDKWREMCEETPEFKKAWAAHQVRNAEYRAAIVAFRIKYGYMNRDLANLNWEVEHIVSKDEEKVSK